MKRTRHLMPGVNVGNGQIVTGVRCIDCVRLTVAKGCGVVVVDPIRKQLARCGSYPEGVTS